MLFSFKGEKLLNKLLGPGNLLLGMHGDGELFLLDLIGFDEGFKVYAALVLIVPAVFVELADRHLGCRCPSHPQTNWIYSAFVRGYENFLDIFHVLT